MKRGRRLREVARRWGRRSAEARQQVQENQHTAAEEGGSGSGRRMEDEERNRPNHAHRFTTRLPTKAAPWARTPPSCVPRAPPFAEYGSWPASRSPPIAGTRSPETTDTSTQEENELRNADENEMNIAQRVTSFLARKAASRRARDTRWVAQFSPERNRGATEEVRTAAPGPGTPLLRSPREGHFGSLHLGTLVYLTDDLPVLTAAAARQCLAELLEDIELWQRLLLELHGEIVTAEDLHAMGVLVGRAFHLRDEALRMRVFELGRCIARSAQEKLPRPQTAREQTPAFRETGAATH